ncbi:MAG: hypothetical protein Kow0090_12140 [Myxococcota bacterium]
MTGFSGLKIPLILFTTALLSSCTPEQTFKSAEEALSVKNIEKAKELYGDVINNYKFDSRLTSYFYSIVDSSDRKTLARRSYERLAEIYSFHLLRHSDGIKYLRKAIALSDDAETANALREKVADIFYSNLKDYQQAIIEYQRILANQPSYAKNADLYLFRVIDSYFRISNYEQTRNESAEFMEKYKKSSYAPLIELLVAQSYDMDNNTQMALAEYDKFLKNFDGNAQYRNLYAEAAFSMGNIYARQDKCDEAEGAYQKSLKSHPHPETVLEKIKAIKERCRKLKSSPERIKQYQELMLLRSQTP